MTPFTGCEMKTNQSISSASLKSTGFLSLIKIKHTCIMYIIIRVTRRTLFAPPCPFTLLSFKCHLFFPLNLGIKIHILRKDA